MATASTAGMWAPCEGGVRARALAPPPAPDRARPAGQLARGHCCRSGCFYAAWGSASCWLLRRCGHSSWVLVRARGLLPAAPYLRAVSRCRSVLSAYLLPTHVLAGGQRQCPAAGRHAGPAMRLLLTLRALARSGALRGLVLLPVAGQRRPRLHVVSSGTRCCLETALWSLPAGAAPGRGFVRRLRPPVAGWVAG